jgi:D-aminoacyl-tRNA deacylase
MEKQVSKSGRIGVRFVIQRVTRASVLIDGKLQAEIGKGLLVLIGIASADLPAQADYLADKLVNLRVFSDDAGRMNRRRAAAARSRVV